MQKKNVGLALFFPDIGGVFDTITPNVMCRDFLHTQTYQEALGWLGDDSARREDLHES